MRRENRHAHNLKLLNRENWGQWEKGREYSTGDIVNATAPVYNLTGQLLREWAAASPWKWLKRLLYCQAEQCVDHYTIVSYFWNGKCNVETSPPDDESENNHWIRLDVK